MKGFTVPAGLGLILLSVSTSVSAAIYRCEHDGKIIYSDHVCGKNARQLNTDDSRHPVSVVKPAPSTRMTRRADPAPPSERETKQPDCPLDSMSSVERRNLRVSGIIQVCEAADDVRDTLGRPSVIKRTVSKGHVRERWVYNNWKGKPVRTVNLDNGKVTSFHK